MTTQSEGRDGCELSREEELHTVENEADTWTNAVTAWGWSDVGLAFGFMGVDIPEL